MHCNTAVNCNDRLSTSHAPCPPGHATAARLVLTPEDQFWRSQDRHILFCSCTTSSLLFPSHWPFRSISPLFLHPFARSHHHSSTIPFTYFIVPFPPPKIALTCSTFPSFTHPLNLFLHHSSARHAPIFFPISSLRTARFSVRPVIFRKSRPLVL